MRRYWMLLAGLIALSTAGCTLPDALFGVFGKYHSDAYSRSDRAYNFQSAVSQSQSYQP